MAAFRAVVEVIQRNQVVDIDGVFVVVPHHNGEDPTTLRIVDPFTFATILLVLDAILVGVNVVDWFPYLRVAHEEACNSRESLDLITLAKV